MLKFDELPSTPENDRIMVQPDQPVEKTIGGLHIPDIGVKVANQGKILSGGLLAMDVMYDRDDRVGDTVLFGQFSGVWEEWEHITKAGNNPDCTHENWAYDPDAKGFRRQGYKCSDCDARMMQEPILVMNVGDILTNVTKAERLRTGETLLVRGEAFGTGKTTHVYRRKGEAPAYQINPETNGVTHVA